MLSCSSVTDGAERLPFLAVRIIYDFALVVENHGGALFGIEGRPVWETLVAWISGTRKSNPGAADFVFESIAILAGTSHGRRQVNIVKDKWNFERVERPQLSVPHRRFPGEVIHVDRRHSLVRFALGFS